MSAHDDDQVVTAQEPWWAPIIEFLQHAARDTLIVFVISINAVLVHYLVAVLRWAEMPEVMITTFRFIEYTIIFCDALIYAVFLGRSAQKLVVRFWNR